jgi:hypothetical protein
MEMILIKYNGWIENGLLLISKDKWQELIQKLPDEILKEYLKVDELSEKVYENLETAKQIIFTYDERYDLWYFGATEWWMERMVDKPTPNHAISNILFQGRSSTSNG